MKKIFILDQIHVNIIFTKFRQKFTIITTKKRDCLIQVNMNKVMIKILQGSAVTQTTLGRLIIYPQVANFLYCTCAKNYESCLAVDKVIAKPDISGPPCM